MLEPVVVCVAIMVLRALCYLHGELGVAHRDIKLANLLYSLAREDGSPGALHHTTTFGHVMSERRFPHQRVGGLRGMEERDHGSRRGLLATTNLPV